MTELRQTIALTHLEFFDHPKTGVAFLGQFDRGVGEVAAALVFGDEFRRLLHKAIKLANRIVRDSQPSISAQISSDFLPLVVQILEDEIVLRTEVTIKRHLAGARRLGDRFDADPADAVAMEEILRAGDDALARPLHASLRDEGLQLRIRIFLSFMALDRNVTDRYQ